MRTCFKILYLFFSEFLPMGSSSEKSQLVKVSPYNLPLSRVRNQEEGESFIQMHLDILNDCNVRWELDHDIYTNLPPSSNPNFPSTKVYPSFWTWACIFLFFFCPYERHFAVLWHSHLQSFSCSLQISYLLWVAELVVRGWVGHPRV